MSGYGGGNPTPAIREIASKGVLFRHFYAAATFTTPSHMSIFTGLDPAQHGVPHGIQQLAPGIPTLAELLRDAGYPTQAFHEGAFVAARFGFDRGFDEYRQCERVSVVGRRLPEILEWMKERSGERYFLFLHTYAAHRPYGGFERYRRDRPERGLPSDADIEELKIRYPNARRREILASGDVSEPLRAICTLYNQLSFSSLGCGDARLPKRFQRTVHFKADMAAIRAGYRERIRLIDAAIAALQADLRERDEWEDTLLVITSDHGEAFFEHGLYMHSGVPFEEVLKIPLVISYPRLLRKDGVRRVDEEAWHLDLLPTILSLARVEAPANLPGRDLTPLLVGRGTPPRARALFPSLTAPFRTDGRPLPRVVLRGQKKLFDDPGAGPGFLFDLHTDPGERENLWETRPELRAEFAALRNAYLERLEPAGWKPAAAPAPLRDLSVEERHQLRVLGYLE